MGNDSTHDLESNSGSLKGANQQLTAIVHEEPETGQSLPVHNNFGDRFKKLFYGQVETRGIEKVDEDEKHDMSITNAATVVRSPKDVLLPVSDSLTSFSGLRQT